MMNAGFNNMDQRGVVVEEVYNNGYGGPQQMPMMQGGFDQAPMMGGGGV